MKAKRAVATHRGRRKRAVRPSVLERAPMYERRELQAEFPDDGRRRLPLTRGDCFTVPRPCVHVGCRFNLYLDVQDSGNVKLNFPDLEPDEMAHSCALDVAERGPSTLEVTAELLNVVRERIRQIEDGACRRLRLGLRRRGIRFDELAPVHAVGGLDSSEDECP